MQYTAISITTSERTQTRRCTWNSHEREQAPPHCQNDFSKSKFNFKYNQLNYVYLEISFSIRCCSVAAAPVPPRLWPHVAPACAQNCLRLLQLDLLFVGLVRIRNIYVDIHLFCAFFCVSTHSMQNIFYGFIRLLVDHFLL